MTTLPQTTNVRLPRPAGGQIQLASQGGALATSAPRAEQGGASDVWRVIRGHIWMILIVVCIIAPAAGYGLNYYLAKNYPRFTSAGFIQVQPQTNPNNVREGGSMVFDPANVALEIRTQAQLLKHESLLTRVLQDVNSQIRQTAWFRQFNNDIRRAKQDFEENLGVTAIQDTKLVKVEFTYSKPEDCRTVVQELVAKHLEEQKNFQTQQYLDRTSMLNNVKIKAEMRLSDITKEMRDKQLKVSNDGGGIGRIGMKEMELSKLVGEQVEAQLLAGKAKSTYDAAVAAISQGQEPPGVDQMVQILCPMLMNDQNTLRQYEMELEAMAEQVGPDHSRFKQMEKRTEAWRKVVKQESDEARAKAKIMVLEQYKQMAEAEMARLEGISKRVDNLKMDLGELTNAMLQYYNLQEEQRGLIQQIKLVKEQIENVMAITSSQHAARVSWMTMPEVPMNRSFPKLWVIMGGAIGLGMLLSLGIAFLREAMDQSIRSPRDIAKVGQINLLGIIPDENDDPQSAGARLPVVIFDAPHSMMAESFRHVRTKLQHTASLDTTRSIMVTSPSPGDGKTTVACNMAAGLALNGRRILLVDANFRRPEIHKIFGLPNEAGFSNVLNAEVSFDEVLRETQVPNLAVMSAGPKPMNPAELFESQLLIDFIERALEEFDHVIFDSGPIMVVAEAQAMAPRVDGVVSVVRAKTNNRGLLQRMRDELRRTKAEHLGVVLNAVRARGGGYYRRSIQTYYDYANGQG